MRLCKLAEDYAMRRLRRYVCQTYGVVIEDLTDDQLDAAARAVANWR